MRLPEGWNEADNEAGNEREAGLNIVVLSRLRARLRELCAAIEVFDAGADVLDLGAVIADMAAGAVQPHQRCSGVEPGALELRAGQCDACAGQAYVRADHAE